VTIAFPRLNRLPAAERGITIADFLVPVRIGEPLSARVRHVVLIVLGALFVALTAQIQIVQAGQSIPLIADFRLQLATTPVPITGQTFGVLLVGGALGLRRGTVALALYLALGLFLPFYTPGPTDGLERFVMQDDAGRWVLGATGGYLVGFVFAAGLVGWLAELGWDRRLIGAIGAMVLGSLVVYVFGTAWLMAAAGFDLPTGIARGVTPFLLFDGLKVLLAAVLFPAAWWVVGRRPGER
jgi:biotin transport system substrate-specific component